MNTTCGWMLASERSVPDGVRPLLRTARAVCAALVACVSAVFAAESDPRTTALRREPAALAFVAGERLVVSNRGSGTLSVIDAAARQVVAEHRLGGAPVAVAALPGGRLVLVADAARNRILLVDVGTGETRRELPVPADPQSVQLAADGRTVAITARWARRATIADLEPAAADDPRSPRDRTPTSPRLTLRKTVDLPFAPREALFVPREKGVEGAERLVVAEAFGGRLAVIDPESGRIVVVHRVGGHNLRGLCLDRRADELLLVHQLLDPRVSTTHDHVFWGGVLRNVLRSIPLAELHGSAAREFSREGMYPLDHPSSATGDPSAVAVSSRGATVIAVAGTSEAAVRPDPLQPFSRRPVGRHPSAVAIDADGRFAYLAETYADAVSVLDLATLKVVATIPLGARREPTEVEEGEMLFRDARLALDGWYSCHSCHTDGHANGQLNDNFGDGTYGDPKRIPSLLGTAGTGPWGWNGTAKSLEAQIRRSVTTTMRGEEPSDAQVRQIAAYVRSLAPPPARPSVRGAWDATASERGRRVFADRGCAACHRPEARFTSPDLHDVGLRDGRGATEFNPPALHGVGQRDSFLHDGRAETLEDVFRAHRHPNGATYGEAELRDLLTYLAGL